MDLGPICQRTLRKAILVLGTSGMLFGVATGCDPNVRTTVLGGFQSLATSVVQAVFLNIESQGTDTTPTSTSTSTTP